MFIYFVSVVSFSFLTPKENEGPLPFPEVSLKRHSQPTPATHRWPVSPQLLHERPLSHSAGPRYDQQPRVSYRGPPYAPRRVRGEALWGPRVTQSIRCCHRHWRGNIEAPSLGGHLLLALLVHSTERRRPKRPREKEESPSVAGTRITRSRKNRMRQQRARLAQRIAAVNAKKRRKKNH